ncbi:transient receptor potential ion channel family protein [Ascoidea rubescens DSM 1968]|uniref:TRP-domain-containing protein n=1 Tax=Ascoidea rubescens DSM 1968 TaxID=1344418 RepID=A0A1D2VBJ2_9ASCO|nr:TRP-domain-containing protein [Ascoidea rubescens DSM 1968]ODV58996.1 TRP-domain-containing protein [Ascoidea rubescens DSM 1968]
MKLFLFLLLFLSSIIPALCKRSLTASSLVTCMDSSQLSASKFNVVFNPDDNSLHYDLDLSSEIDGYVQALIQVYAYGFEIIRNDLDLCSLDLKQFCPLYPGPVDIDSVNYIDLDLANQIPNIAYTVPDIDAFLRLTVTNNNGTQIACIQASFSNGKSVSHVAVKWVTAGIAGLGLLVSALLSCFGNSNAASHISSNALSLFTYFQSVVIVTMLHVDQLPPIASAWSQNLSWSMGLINIKFMQDIFRWYVQSTGGSPTTYFSSEAISILVQRAYNLIKKRSKTIVLYGNSHLLIFRGIKRVGYLAGIETSSIVVTGFTFFIVCAYVLIVISILAKLILKLRSNILKGSLSKYIYIGFAQLTIFSLWEFTERDSTAIVVLAALFLFTAIAILYYACYRTLYFGRMGIINNKNPASNLYGDENVLNKYGFFYTMYNAKTYWWSSVHLIHITIKCIFIALCQKYGKVQTLVVFINDLIYFIALIYYKPFLDKPTNILNILIMTVTTLNSFLFLFFSNLFHQPAAVGSIMGWVFFILNAAFSLILLIWVIFYSSLAIFSKNPDSRFQPAKDDRRSFQKRNSLTSNSIMSLKDDDNNDKPAELLALGTTAKDHQLNWDTDLKRASQLSYDSLSKNYNNSSNYNSDNSNTNSNPNSNINSPIDNNIDAYINSNNNPNLYNDMYNKY